MKLSQRFALLLLATVPVNGDTLKCKKRKGNFPIRGTLCKGYIECTGWHFVKKSCGEDEHFNEDIGECDFEDNFPCFEKPKSKECPTDNGLYLKPGTGCKIYYDCCDGKAKEKRCLKDMLFDPSRGKCEYPEYYTCVEDTSTEQPSTTALNIVTMFTSPVVTEKEEQSTLKLTTGVSSEPSSPLDDTTKEHSTYSTTLSTSETNFPPISTQSTKDGDSSSNEYTKTMYETSTATPVVLTQSTSETEISTENKILFSLSTYTESTASEETTSPPEMFTTEETEITTFKETEDTTDEWIESIKTETESESPEVESSTSSISTEKSFTDDIIITLTTENSKSTSREIGPRELTGPTEIVEATTVIEGSAWCPEPQGYFPHPTNKHKFIGCVDSIPSVLTCPANLVYRHERRRCDYE